MKKTNILKKIKTSFLKLSFKRRILFTFSCFTVVFSIVCLFKIDNKSYGADNTTLKDYYAFTNMNSVIESVNATKITGNYLDSDSSFEIKTKEEMEVEELQKHIAISPAIDYKIKMVDNKSFLVIPKEKIPNNTLVNVISVEEGNSLYKWAFETEKILTIKSTYPKDTGNIGTKGVIEVTLTYPDVVNFEESFTISGNVKGKFTQDGYTYRFIPDNDLEENKTYYVTIKKGLTNNSHTMTDDYTFSFTVYNEYYYSKLDKFSFTSSNLDQSLTFTEDVKPKIGIGFNTNYGENNLVDIKDASIKLYKLTKEEYTNLLNSEEYDINSLNLFDSFVAKIEKYSNSEFSQRLAYIEYPKTLPKGNYLASYTIGDTTKNQFIQISNIVAYVGNTEKDIIVWLNDYNTKKEIEGAEVFYNNKSVFSDKEGICIIKNKNNTGDNFVYIKNNSDELLVKLNTLSNTYYSGLIYTDKPLYKSNDTINIWGFIPEKNLRNNKNYYLKFLDKTYLVNINEDGIFSTEIPLSNIKEQYSSIMLLYDEEVIATRTIQIKNYETPNYIYTIQTDKNTYNINDEIKVDISVEHISGVKAVNKQLQVIYENQNISCVTDEMGRCQVTLTATKEEKYYSATSSQTIRVRAIDAVDSEDLCKKTITLINEKTKIDVTSNSKNGKFYIYVKGYNLGIKNGNLNTTNDLSSKVKVEIYEKSYDIKKITKVNEYTKEKYTYYSRENYKDNLTKTVYYDLKNGKLEINDLKYNSIETSTQGKYYYFEIALDNSLLSDTLYYYVSNTDKITYNTSYYTTSHPNYFCSGYFCYNYYNYYNDSYLINYFPNISNKYSVNDKIDIKVNNYKNEPLLDKKLVYIFEDSIIDYYFDEENIEYKEEYIPGVMVAGAVFDGSKNYMINANYLKYKESDRDLNISLTTDKDIYSPQDIVNLNIKVTDKDNKPIKTNVLISVVNEGVFKLIDDYIYTNTVLNYKYFGFYQFSTYQDLLYDSSIIGGMGAATGGEYNRNDFGDTIYFKNIITDENGNYKLKFKLNDSVTTFRITAIALNQDLYNASTNIKIKSQLPYFIENSSLDGFKTSDDFVVATNTLSNNNIETNYTFKLDNKEYLNKGLTNKYIYQNFGNLNKGNHTLEISSGNNNYLDRVKYNFNIRDYYNEVRIETNEQLVNGVQKIGINSDEINIELYDKSLGFYLKLINNLNYFGGERLDQYIAKQKGNELYNKYNKTSNYSNISIPTRFIQNNQLYLLENSVFSPLLNALVVNYASNMLNDDIINNLTTITKNVLDSKNYDNTYYFDYIVLASALKTISLEELRTYSSIDIKDNIDLALAFTFIGDYDSAIKIYNENIKNSEYYNDNIDMILILLSFIEPNECKRLLVEKMDSTSEYYTFAILSYLENSSPIVEDVIVNINNQEYILNKLSVTSFKFRKDEINNLNITSNNNDVMIRKVYYGSPKEIEDKNKIYSVKIDINDELKLNQTYNLKVTIKDMPKDRCGNLYIALPKGIRYYGINAKYNYDTYLIKNSSNLLTYSICTKTNHSINFEIPIITTLEGNYTFESSVYNHNIYYGVSDEFKIKITK